MRVVRQPARGFINHQKIFFLIKYFWFHCFIAASMPAPYRIYSDTGLGGNSIMNFNLKTKKNEQTKKKGRPRLSLWSPLIAVYRARSCSAHFSTSRFHESEFVVSISEKRANGNFLSTHFPPLLLTQR